MSENLKKKKDECAYVCMSMCVYMIMHVWTGIVRLCAADNKVLETFMKHQPHSYLVEKVHNQGDIEGCCRETSQDLV